VLKWIVERLDGETAGAVETPIGRVPSVEAVDTAGSTSTTRCCRSCWRVDTESWRNELPQLEDHYRGLGDRVPPALREQLEDLEKRLSEA